MAEPSRERRPRVSVVMPTFRQAAFIRRAIESVRAQTIPDWELLIVNDGSPDETDRAVAPCLADPRIRYLRFERNRGLGRALNVGLQGARANLIAYLPSDDLWYAPHLERLLDRLAEHPEAVLAYAGVRHDYNRRAAGPPPGEPLQLVQTLHRLTPDRWLERPTLTTDDLDVMFWDALRQRGPFVGDPAVTCEWVSHPHQRHKLLREPEGGVNRYRQWCAVKEPLRVKTRFGNRIDEPGRFGGYRERPDTPPAANGLKILLVGELAYNADRVLALEERGHQLFGLWMPEPYWYNSVGPLPFGHVRDLDPNDWRADIQRVRPDVIYALLNWQAVPFVRSVLAADTGVPFVWHFKEGPFICLEKGSWDDLIALYAGSDGHVYCSDEMRDWFATVVPDAVADRPSLVLDGDLPKRDWFRAARAPLLSEANGDLHTVVPGRPIGLHPETVAQLGADGIHLHFYGDFTQGQWRAWIERARSLAPRHLHLHPHVDQERWVEEFSRYDAGWLHAYRSQNHGDIRQSDWDDLNVPARMATLAVAGLPMIQVDNRGARVAAQTIARERDFGVFYASIPDLARQLRDRARMSELRENAWRARDAFTFDHHADRLVAFFRSVIDRAGRA